jgi:pyruvate-formate lyase-activating enzyme
MTIRLASTLQPDSIVDGEGIRTVVWTQGCPHHCPFCHNPQTHDFNGGYVVELDDMTSESDNSIEWGFYLYSKVMSHSHCSNFTIYYSDGFEIITKWFPGFILRNNVSLSLLARNSVEKGVSATSVREMILSGSPNLKDIVPDSVDELKDTLKIYIELSKGR